MSRLEAEMVAAASNLRAHHCQRLSAMGVKDFAYMTEVGSLGVLPVSIGASDLWEHDEGGALHLCVAVCEGGALVDIVAFRPEDPNAWGLRTGNGWALGADNVHASYSGWTEEEWTLPIHATPLDWLRAGCVGACVIDGFSAQAADAIRDCRALQVDRPAFARALRLQLNKPRRLPEIIMSEGARHAA